MVYYELDITDNDDEFKIVRVDNFENNAEFVRTDLTVGSFVEYPGGCFDVSFGWGDTFINDGEEQTVYVSFQAVVNMPEFYGIGQTSNLKEDCLFFNVYNQSEIINDSTLVNIQAIITQSALKRYITKRSLAVDGDNFLGNGGGVDLSSIENKIDTLNLDIKSLLNGFNSFSLNNLEFISLNGSNGSIKDGSFVNVSEYTDVFRVVSSQMLKNDKTLYLIVYILEDEFGKRFLVPSTAVTLKV